MKTFKGFIKEGSKEEYQKFFDKKLKKYGVDSPDDLSDEEKKKFYDEIDKEWKADHEEKKEALVKEYIKKDGARRRCAGGDGRRTKKKVEEGEDCEDDEELEESLKQLIEKKKSKIGNGKRVAGKVGNLIGDKLRKPVMIDGPDRNKDFTMFTLKDGFADEKVGVLNFKKGTFESSDKKIEIFINAFVFGEEE